MAVTRYALFTGGALLLVVLVGTVGPPLLHIGHFSAQSPARSVPAGWEEVRFGKNESSTAYDLVRGDSVVVVRARSQNGASGLITRQRVDLAQYPILEWRWKVERLPQHANVATDTTDDAAARLYVTFDYDGLGLIDRFKLMLLRRFGYAEAPSRALNYLWATERETPLASPYTNQIMMLPVRTGGEDAGRWVQERRNVLADYRRVFEADPPPVNGVALMTDSDNTGGSATAFYGDIVFRPAHSASDSTGSASAGSD